MSGPKYSQAKLNELNKRLVSVNIDIESAYSQITAILNSNDTRLVLESTPFCMDDSLMKTYEQSRNELHNIAGRITPPNIARQTFGESEINARLTEAEITKDSYINLRNELNEKLHHIRKILESINQHLSTSIVEVNQNIKSKKDYLDKKFAQLPADYTDYVESDRQKELNNLYEQTVHALESISPVVPFADQQNNSKLKFLYNASLQNRSRITKLIDKFKTLADLVYKKVRSGKIMNLGEIKAIKLEEEGLDEILRRIKAETVQSETGKDQESTDLKDYIQKTASDILNYPENEYSEKAKYILEDVAKEMNTSKLYLYLQQLKLDRSELCKKFEADRIYRKKLHETRMSIIGIDQDHLEIELLLKQIESLEKEQWVDPQKVMFLVQETTKASEAIKQKKIKEEEQSLVRKCVYEALKSFDYVPDSDFETCIVNKTPMIFSTVLGSDYRVRTSFSPKGEMITRLIRVVGSKKQQEVITERQKIKDMEAMETWCRDYDRLISFMRENGVDANIIWRKPPEIEHLEVVVDETYKRSTSRRQSLAKNKAFMQNADT